MINTVVMSGRLAREHKVMNTSGGKTCLRNVIAYHKKFSKNEDAEYIDIIAWEKTANLIEKYTKKGTRVTVKGFIQQKYSENKEIRKHEIVVEELEFEGAKNDTNGVEDENSDAQFDRYESPTPNPFPTSQPTQQYKPNAMGVEVSDDDIPF
jgi:single-strand DNA-binding protein